MEKKLATVTGIERVDTLNQLTSELMVFQVNAQIAQKHGNEALALADSLKYAAGKEKALLNLGVIHNKLGRYSESMQYYQQAQALNQISNNQKIKEQMLSGMADSIYSLGKYKEAMALYQQGLTIAQELGDKEMIAATYDNIGYCFYTLGDIQQALDYFSKSLELYEQLQLKIKIVPVLCHFGQLYDSIGSYEKSLQYNYQSLRLAEELTDKSGMAMALSGLGINYMYLNNYTKALECHYRSYQIHSEIDYKNGMAITLGNIGAVYGFQGKNKEALDTFKQSLQIFNKLGDRENRANCLSKIGEIYFSLKEIGKAQEYQRQALQISRQIGNPILIAASLQLEANIQINLKEYQKAITITNEVLKIAQDIKSQALIMESYLRLAELFEMIDDNKVALKYQKLFHKKDKEIFNETSNKQMQELQTKYETDKKSKENELLTAKNDLLAKDNRLQKATRNTLILGFIVVLMSVGLLAKKYFHLIAFWKSKNHISHFRIIDKIASGGMATVYKAYDMHDPAHILAVKVLREEYSRDEDNKRRFIHEAVIIDQLNDPHILKVFERGEQGENLFIAMEYLEGKSLGTVMEAEKFTIPMALTIIVQILETVAKIHEKHIIHRDLKPENIMLVDKGEDPYFVKILDFGIAKSQNLSQLTKTGVLLGTAHYLSPEQINGEKVTPASDVYAIGVICYQMFTGKKPFCGETGYILIQQILHTTPIAPIELNTALPQAISTIVMQMLDKIPPNRPTALAALQLFQNPYSITAKFGEPGSDDREK